MFESFSKLRAEDGLLSPGAWGKSNTAGGVSIGGARPGICFGEYETVDAAAMKAYAMAVKEGTIKEFLANAGDRRA